MKAAELNVKKSLAVADRQTATLFELRSGTSLAHPYQQQGQAPKRYSRLQHIINKYDPAPQGRDLQIARGLAETPLGEIHA